MLNLNFSATAELNVLCIGAHCDDIEIGCGGSLLELQARFPRAFFHWAVFSGDAVRTPETQGAAQRIHGSGARHSVEVAQFRGSYFPYDGAAIKDQFEAVKGRISPNLILTHHLNDRHQDHRLLAELTWNTFRNHLVLEYEIPKYEGDFGHPNLYLPLTREQVERKVAMLWDCFPSQHGRPWFTQDLFLAHLRLRGMECNAPSGFAEAFHARKLVI